MSAKPKKRKTPQELKREQDAKRRAAASGSAGSADGAAVAHDALRVVAVRADRGGAVACSGFGVDRPPA